MISEQLKKQIEESKQEFWKEREINTEAKYIIKNHKGDIEMEYIGKHKKRMGASGFSHEHSIDSYHFSVDEKEEQQQKQNKKQKSTDCIEIQMVDYQSKLKEKLQKSELVFLDIFKENTNEIKLKKQTNLEIQKKQSNENQFKSTKISPQPNFILNQNGKFLNKKNVNLIKGVFEEADISPSRFYEKKNLLITSDSKSTSSHQKRKEKKKKTYSRQNKRKNDEKNQQNFKTRNS